MGIAFAQRQIEAVFLKDTIEITRPGIGEPVLDESTFAVVYPAGSTLYSGAASVTPTISEFSPQQNLRENALAEVLVHVPVSATDVVVGDTVTVLTADDAELVGREYEVIRFMASTRQMSRRMLCYHRTQGI